MAAKVDLDTTPTSLEGQFVECAREMQQAEDAWIATGLAATPPVTRTRRVTVTPNLANGTLVISATLPITSSDAANGYTLAVTPHIV